MVEATLVFNLDDPKDEIRHKTCLEYINGKGTMIGPPIESNTSNTDNKKVYVKGELKAISFKKGTICIENEKSNKEEWYKADPEAYKDKKGKIIAGYFEPSIKKKGS